MTKLMIGTPAHKGNLSIGYALSYAKTVQLLAANGIFVVPRIAPSGSLLVEERNRIIEDFWKSDCTHLLCIDADLGWAPPAVQAMLDVKKDIVAGVYPARGPQETIFLFRPILNEDSTFINENHLLKMEYVPAGFLMLSRECVKKMREALPELHYAPKQTDCSNPPEAFMFFNTEIHEGEFWGEDFTFCRNAKKAGIDIWVDPLIQFDHDGQIGVLHQYIASKQAKAAEQAQTVEQKDSNVHALPQPTLSKAA
jgi:hypothetical protein